MSEPLKILDIRFSERFRRVRTAHQKEIAEDYVKMIAELLDERGEARLVDLATRLGVSKPTVNNAIQRLQRSGYVTSQRYRAIFLTDKGHALARMVRERNQTIFRFLVSIGIDKETAESDTEGIEHHVSQQTLDAMRKFLAPQP